MLPYHLAPAVPSNRDTPRPGLIGRDLLPRPDRPPADARVDLPEIQESTRVSFSDGARAQAAGGLHSAPDAPPQPAAGPESSARALAAYRAIARL